ncbi:tetratricopeptide repeat protein [uncultured Croceitalea sp.]|uniref:tetratricopeptide repeat protein n=1 Tax=uncultured Croceitalea sp. TaxID=1798908 RepID=UPI0033068E05
MKTKVYLLLCILTFPIILIGQYQKKYDSLAKIYKNAETDSIKVNLLYDMFVNSYLFDLELAKQHVDEELMIAKKLNSNNAIADAYHLLNIYQRRKGHRDSALFYSKLAKENYTLAKDKWGLINSNKSIAISKLELGFPDDALKINEENKAINLSLKDSSGLAEYYNFNGAIYEHTGDHKLAIENLLKSIEIYDLLDNQIGKADGLYVLTAIEVKEENYEKGVEYALEALSIYEIYNDDSSAAFAMCAIGECYFKLKKYSEAKKYLTKSIELATKAGPIDIEGIAKEQLGTLLIETKDFDSGIKLLLESIEIKKKSDYSASLLVSLNAVGKAYNSINSPQKAITYSNEVIKISDSIKSPELLSSAYEIRSQAYKSLGDYKRSLNDYVAYNKIKDSLFNEAKLLQINTLRTEFDTERKEKELVIEKDKVEILEKESQISYQQKLLLGGGMTLSLMALGFGFYGFRQKTKRNQLEKDKVEAELAFKKKELTTHALHLAKKNEVLENVKLKAKDLKLQGDTKGYQELIKTINFDQQDDKNWESFTQYFEQVHKDFAKNVKNKYPDVTKNELRFMALLKMNMSSKEIATILNISPDGIKKARQRLRKKMALTPEISLENTVLAI